MKLLLNSQEDINMSKILDLNLRLKFSDKIYTDDDVKEIVENVVAALEHKVEVDMLTPENCDAYTEEITVSSSLFEIEKTRQMF